MTWNWHGRAWPAVFPVDVDVLDGFRPLCTTAIKYDNNKIRQWGSLALPVDMM